MTPETQSPTPSQPPVMSREEWMEQVMAVLNQVANRKPIVEKIQAHVDAIMALQSEVERLGAELNGAISVISSARKDLDWPDSGTHHEAAYHALNDFEKARQPK